MTKSNQRILVVDDEQDLCEILKFNLETEGYEVETANSAEEAIVLDIPSYDLLLLDVMMGEMSGFALAKKLKADERTSGIPIIFLTARDTENDTVTGFNLGADDYISKPFSIREVLVRIRAVLRRTAPQTEEGGKNILKYQGLVLDLDKKTVTIEGKEVAFTKTEFELLHLLHHFPALCVQLQKGGDVRALIAALAHGFHQCLGILTNTFDIQHFSFLLMKE